MFSSSETKLPYDNLPHPLRARLHDGGLRHMMRERSYKFRLHGTEVA